MGQLFPLPYRSLRRFKVTILRYTVLTNIEFNYIHLCSIRKEVLNGRQRLDYLALGILLTVAITLLYAVIGIHDIPYEISKKT